MPRLEERCKRGGREGPRGSAASTSAAPSATSRGGSTTSCAAAPAARAIPAPLASSSPPQDDLVRHFAGDRIYKILDRLGPVDDEGEEYPLEAKMLTKQIENAQKKVEEQNFLSRKRVLEYDDVMNEQRRVVYRYRREVLEGRDMGDIAREQLGGVVSRKVDEYTASDVFEEWDLGDLESQLNTRLAGLASSSASSTRRPQPRDRSPRCSPRTPSPPTTSARRSSGTS